MCSRQVDVASVQQSSGCGTRLSSQVSLAAGGGLLQEDNVTGTLQRLLPTAVCQTWSDVLQWAQAAGPSALLLQAAWLRRQQPIIELAMGTQHATIQ